MKPDFADPTLSRPKPLAHYADLLESAAARRAKKPKKRLIGATEQELQDLELFFKRPIPSLLREWFSLCNGQIFHFNSIPLRQKDSIAVRMGPKYWQAPDWIPIAGDGCGCQFGVPFEPIAGLYPVAFFDTVDFANPDYWVASDLERFLYLYVELDDWVVCDIDLSFSEEMQTAFFFDRDLITKVDPKLTKLPEELLPWVRANATD